MLISAAHEDIEKHGELAYLCKTDHYLAKVMHARLIRTQTEALAATAVITGTSATRAPCSMRTRS